MDFTLCSLSSVQALLHRMPMTIYVYQIFPKGGDLYFTDKSLDLTFF